MMRSTSMLLAATLLLPVLLGAQDGAKEQVPARKESAQEAFDRLTTELTRQNAVYRVARSAAQKSEAYRAARKRRDNPAALAILRAVPQPQAVALAKEAMALADGFEGDDRLKLISWAAIHGRDADLVRAVAEEVLEKHTKQPSVAVLFEHALVIRRAVGIDYLRMLLNRVVETSPHDMVRAWGMYWQARTYGDGRGVSPVERAKIQSLLDDAEKLAKGTLLGDRIGGRRFQQNRLQVGMVAPNIEGHDADGKALALYDYRGKVTVIDFWGFWCNGSVVMMPRKKAMVARLKDKPFALVGVNSDPCRSYYLEEVEKMGVTWPSFWQGVRGVGGLIPSRWGIVGWPTSYVLDHKGVIRHVGLRGEKLEQAVDQLLAEMADEETGKSKQNSGQ